MLDTETKFDLYQETYQLSDGSLVNCQIIDTSGKEKFNSLNRQYYTIADCCLLVYDITYEDSFSAIEKYYVKEIKKYCKEKNIMVILVGNKVDLKDERKISSKDGAILANNYKFMFKETSCEYNYNVADVFETIIAMTHTEKMERGEYNNKTKSFKLGEMDEDIILPYDIDNKSNTNITENKTKKKTKKNNCLK